MSNYKTVYPVAGLGSRRENQSWNNFRDAWHKAGISGRRLKNVLDLLEAEPKRALQETDRLIKKFGASPPFLACKALALHRHDSASRKVQRICEELVDSIPVTAELDELTVLCVLHFFQHQTADYVRLHGFLQKLAAVSKNNCGVMDLIQLTYFRHHNSKEMQKVAMDLAKIDAPNADRHYVMTVISLIMQALDGTDANKKRILLMLAYRTLDKRFPQMKPRSNEGVLKLWLLIEIGDVNACLQFLEEYKCQNKPSNDWAWEEQVNTLVKEVCRLLVRAGRLDEAECHLLENAKIGNMAGDFIEVLVEILAQRFLIKISEAQLTLSATLVAGELNAILERLNSALPEDLSKCVESMAHLQLFRKLLRTLTTDTHVDIIHEVETGLLDEISRYFDLVGDRSCFYTDIKDFLLLLNPSRVDELLARLCLPQLASSGLCDSKHPLTTISEVIRHQNALVLRFAFRNVMRENTVPWSFDKENTMSTVKQLLSLRVHVTEAEGLASLQRPDMVKLGDVYATVAVYALFDLFQRNQEWTVLLDAIILLESTLSNAKPFCNPSLRILLIHLYLRCGAINSAYEHFARADIKSLQLNHLSFLIASPLLVTGVSDTTVDLLDSMMRFYTNTVFEDFEAQLQSITRERDNYFGVVKLELLKRSLKYSSGFIYANYARLWSLPTRRLLTDLDARNWILETERYLGTSVMAVVEEGADRAVVPSLDVVFDQQEATRNVQLYSQEMVWLSVLKSQMALYAESFSLASTYARYNPFEGATIQDQLLDYMPTHHLDLALDGPGSVRRSSDALFTACKSADETLPCWRSNLETENVSHLSVSFPHPLGLYLTMGCHAVHLRLGQLASVLEMILSAAIQNSGGIPAYLVVKVQEGADDEAAKENGTTAKKSFAVILDRLEISLKLQQMVDDIFAKFDDSHILKVYRYRDMIISVSLLAQVIRCLVWIVQCVRDSLNTLSMNNDKRAGGKSSQKSVDFRKVMEEWFLGFALFLENLQNPIHAVAEKLHAETEKLSTSDFFDQILKGAGTNFMEFPLCFNEPAPEKRADDALRIKGEICDGWKKSLKELSSVFNESGALLAQFSHEARSKIKSKAGKSAPIS